jgi:hypothetical protein
MREKSDSKRFTKKNPAPELQTTVREQFFSKLLNSLSLGPAGCCWSGGVVGPSRGFGSAKSLEQRPVGTGWEEQPRTSHSVWLGIVHSPLPSYRQLATNAIHILIHIHIHNNVNQSTTAVTTSTIKIIK